MSCASDACTNLRTTTNNQCFPNSDHLGLQGILISANSSSYQRVMGEREISQLVKCLLCKHEDLSLDPQDPCKMLGTAMPTCNHSAREEEVGGSWELAAQPI